MNTRTVTHQYRLSKWAPIIKECKSSDLTVKNWCLENDVNEKRYYYWQRKLRESLVTTMIEKTVTKEQPTTFIPMMKPQTPSTAVTSFSSFTPDMVLDTGSYRLEISNAINPQLLSEMMKVLHHV